MPFTVREQFRLVVSFFCQNVCLFSFGGGGGADIIGVWCWHALFPSLLECNTHHELCVLLGGGVNVNGCGPAPRLCPSGAGPKKNGNTNNRNQLTGKTYASTLHKENVKTICTRFTDGISVSCSLLCWSFAPGQPPFTSIRDVLLFGGATVIVGYGSTPRR